MGHEEIRALALVEWTLGYHPLHIEFLTCGSGYQRTVSGGQFDWGGRLPKSNGGARRFPQNGWKSFKECKGRRELDCETNRSLVREDRDGRTNGAPVGLPGPQLGS